MALTSVGIYEFNAKDLIGHGAFAVVYKGRLKTVSNLSLHRSWVQETYSWKIVRMRPLQVQER